MARQQVIQVQCDRCKRVSLQVESPAKAHPDFEAVFLGKRLCYADLCDICKKTIENTWGDLAEWDKELKQKLFVGPTVPDNQSAPLDVAPSYTPPKPHSAAGAKRR